QVLGVGFDRGGPDVGGAVGDVHLADDSEALVGLEAHARTAGVAAGDDLVLAVLEGGVLALVVGEAQPAVLGHDLDVGQRVGTAVVAGADEVVGALALGELRGGRIDADGGGGGGLTVLAAVALVRPARAKGQRGQGDGGDDGGGADGAKIGRAHV